MAKIIWDEVSKRFYETGVEQGVLYLRNNVGGISERCCLEWFDFYS